MQRNPAPLDLKKLKDSIRERVINYCDHSNLNEDVDFLRGIIPTAENLARAFWRQLAPAIRVGKMEHAQTSDDPWQR